MGSSNRYVDAVKTPQPTLAPPPPAMSAKISRRQALKLAALAGVALPGAAVLLRPEDVLAVSYYWGTDTNSAACCGMPENFYIGQMGAGATDNAANFSITAARQAGFAATYGYWTLEGANSPNKPGGYTAAQWGNAQANAALTAWCSGTYQAYLGGSTIFADIESGNLGWDGSPTANNQAVASAFLSRVKTGYGRTSPCVSINVNGGIYVSPRDWQSMLGTGFLPSVSPFVLWLAGCQTCAISCAPCNNNCSGTLTQVQNLWPFTIGNQQIMGGSAPAIWQYWCQCSGTRPPCYPWNCDYDVTSQFPGNNGSGFGQFVPLGSSVGAWSCSGCGVSGCQ